jgi:hypothetical protein
MSAVHDELLSLVPRDLHAESGAVFYSGRAAFGAPSSLYLLGLNPGGDPLRQGDETIGAHIDAARRRTAELWSSYADDSWGGRPPGTAKMQPRVLHLIRGLGLDVRRTPASNVAFVRTSREADLVSRKAQLLRACWPVHEAVIGRLGSRS